MFDVDAKQAVEAHPLVCDPGQKEKRENVTTPVFKQNLKAGNDNYEQRYPMAKAIFAGKNVEELALQDIAAAFALRLTDIPPFAKDLFLCDGPRDGRDDDRENDYPKYLPRDRHKKFGVPPLGGGNRSKSKLQLNV